MNTINRENAEHYIWGSVCDGWHLLRTAALSIIEEKIPPGGSELRHHHEASNQFFYVLAGTLSFEVSGQEFDLEPRQAVQIGPSVPHRVFNRSSGNAEFLVISSPPSHGDRVPD
jgi:mannose-6-phosphate isomerase-like protein (cupin superfamily)